MVVVIVVVIVVLVGYSGSSRKLEIFNIVVELPFSLISASFPSGYL